MNNDHGTEEIIFWSHVPHDDDRTSWYRTLCDIQDLPEVDPSSDAYYPHMGD